MNEPQRVDHAAAAARPRLRGRASREDPEGTAGAAALHELQARGGRGARPEQRGQHHAQAERHREHRP